MSLVNKATGVGDKIINATTGLRQMIENGNIRGALQEVITRNSAGMEQYTRDGAAMAEDARQTSQKYLHGGADIAYKSPHTGQTVNRFEALVDEQMNVGPKGKYAIPDPHEVAADSALADQIHGILTKAKTAMSAVDAGTANANSLLEGLILSARTAGKAVVDSNNEGPC